jgi:hypothetical protein
MAFRSRFPVEVFLLCTGFTSRTSARRRDGLTFATWTLCALGGKLIHSVSSAISTRSKNITAPIDRIASVTLITSALWMVAESVLTTLDNLVRKSGLKIS